MKKIIYVLILGSFISLSSCGPSYCDCIEHKADKDKCIEKYKELTVKQHMEKMKRCD